MIPIYVSMKLNFYFLCFGKIEAQEALNLFRSSEFQILIWRERPETIDIARASELPAAHPRLTMTQQIFLALAAFLQTSLLISIIFCAIPCRH